jgi:phosphonoacetate hydrolase
MAPFLISEPLHPAGRTRAAGDLRNFDLFDLTLNGTH